MKAIFISSTFKDMHAERDMLDRDVFPEISEFIRGYGEALSFIDLRWGINTQTLEDDESTHKILSVCLDEIDNSKPYLIAFLGERYGWIPDKRLIENALKQKPPEFSYLAEFEKSVTALEIEYGALSQKNLIDHCLFYFREPFQAENLKQEYKNMYCSEGEEHKRRLEALKSQIINSGGNIKNYKANWDEENSCVTGLHDLKEQIICDLKELIIKDFGQKKLLPWQKREIEEAEFFFREKLSCYSARTKLCDEITDKIFSGSTKLVVIKGSFGFGKSTMMAKLAANAQEREAHVLPIACGRSENTLNYFDVCRQIVFYLEEILNLPVHLGGEEFEYKPSELSVDWVKVIQEKIYQCSQKFTEPIVISIDGVDKLSFYQDFKDIFMRLLSRLSKNIVFVLSCVDDFDIPFELDEKIKCCTYTLDLLDADEKKLVLDKLESLYYRKELVFEVKNKLLSMTQSNNPLYLTMMYQRMIMLDSSDFKEIMSLGDGLQGQTEYMLRLTSEAPNDIDGVCSMIINEAASRINKELCNEVLQLIAVSRGGLREKDLRYIFKQRYVENTCIQHNSTYNLLDFRRLYKYMRPFFFERNDGRINFTYENIRLGILKNLSELQLKQLNEEIFALLESLSDDDRVHRDEYVWFAWKCDKKMQFLKRIENYNDKHLPARGLHDVCMYDKGEWLINILKECTEPIYIGWLLDIIRIDFCVYFNTSYDEMMVLKAIMDQALQSAEYIAKNYSTSDIINNLSVLPYYMGYICELYKLYDEALVYYNKTIEMYNIWGEDVNGYEFIYDKIGDVYKICGNYDQALGFYRKTINCYERKAKATGKYYGFMELIFNYEKAIEFCKLYGKPDVMVEFQNKVNDIKELEERSNNDRGDNLFFKFEFIIKMIENQMEEAAEHKLNGKSDEALQCYESAFELLENEIKKWNKSENLKCLGALYEKLAIESETCGNILMSQTCLHRFQKVTEFLTKESDHGEWYYYFKTKWQKIKVD